MNIAAVWEMILACEWGRIWWGITHAHWTNVWASISAIFTCGAVIVAGIALRRWRKQDELKAKMSFKLAVSEYLVSAINFDANQSPNNLSQLIDDFTACRHAWWVMEGLLAKDKNINKAWGALKDGHNKFQNDSSKFDHVSIPCQVIIAHSFVFN